MIVIRILILTVLAVGVIFDAALGESSTADVKAASTDDRYVTDKTHKSAVKTSESSDYATEIDPTSGLDENGENYIPFQWQVEIIKREYDDYVLPDGTVYRVPAGALPPYRHRGPASSYKVPYRVFKTGETHSDVVHGKPKLVETYDRQLLELLMQSWYENNYWDRYVPPARGANYKNSDDAYYGDDEYYDRSASSPVADNTRRAPAKERMDVYEKNDDLPHDYYMTSYLNNKQWKQ